MTKVLPLYSKSGDTGKSALISGRRISKSHPIFHTLGNLDELNSYLGWCAVLAPPLVQKDLHRIQHVLLDIGAIIAGSTKPKLTPAQISFLEKKIDRYQQSFDKKWFTKFLLPGGSELAARVDITRTVCRRTERSLIHLIKNKSIKLRTTNYALLITFLNRLSDYLYTLRCYINLTQNLPESTHNP